MSKRSLELSAAQRTTLLDAYLATKRVEIDEAMLRGFATRFGFSTAHLRHVIETRTRVVPATRRPKAQRRRRLADAVVPASETSREQAGCTVDVSAR